MQEPRLNLHGFPATEPTVAPPPALRDGLGPVEPQAQRGALWIVEPAEVRSEFGGTFALQVLDGTALCEVLPELEVLTVTFDELLRPVVRVAPLLADGGGTLPLLYALTAEDAAALPAQ